FINDNANTSIYTLSLHDALPIFEPYDLASDVLLPKFNIPEEFRHPEDELDNGTRGEMAYLRHITYEGAKKRYDEITPEIKERLEDRKSTRLNSSHVKISYAVFCL